MKRKGPSGGVGRANIPTAALGTRTARARPAARSRYKIGWPASAWWACLDRGRAPPTPASGRPRGINLSEAVACAGSYGHRGFRGRDGGGAGRFFPRRSALEVGMWEFGAGQVRQEPCGGGSPWLVPADGRPIACVLEQGPLWFGGRRARRAERQAPQEQLSRRRVGFVARASHGWGRWKRAHRAARVTARVENGVGPYAALWGGVMRKHPHREPEWLHPLGRLALF